MSSSPSTPRTTRSVSAAADSPEVLTPGRKIKAMLAAFDSDSDSDNTQPKSRPPRTNVVESVRHIADSTRAMTMDSEDDDDEDDIIMPKGRMAARLQAQTRNDTDATRQAPSEETALDRVSKLLRREKESEEEAEGVDGQSHSDLAEDQDMSSDDDDDLPAAGPRRRIQKTQTNQGVHKSPAQARSFSPLFMSSPTRQQSDAEEQQDVMDSDKEEEQPKKNNRFLALVAQKRKEREEKERLEAEKKALLAKKREQFSSDIVAGDESEDDGGSGRRLTQQSRPTRKASKKALEEMNRETQRMSRNMQLAHQAQTKKKITKESFFARFNFMQPEEPTSVEQLGENSSTTADSQHSSDVEAQKSKETPHTSPVLGPSEKPSNQDTTKQRSEAVDVEFPTLEDILTVRGQDIEQPIAQRMEVDTTNGDPEALTTKRVKTTLTLPPVRVRLSRDQVARHQKDDSDSDLEIVTSPSKCRRIAAFENISTRQNQESASMFKLKALANLTSPNRKSTMNSAELSATLLYQAKMQAAEERRERIEELRAKGIVIETAAERAALEDEVENLVEKARQEGEEIARKERKAAKAENGEDVDDDEDYEFSGSEEEDGDGDNEEEVDEDDEGEEDEEEVVKAADAEEQGLFDSEAEENDDDESEDDQSQSAILSPVKPTPTQRRKRAVRVISDDEDEDPAPNTPARPINPFLNSVERPVIPIDPMNNATMSLTQAFAGTLAAGEGISQIPHDSSTLPPSLPEPVPMNLDGGEPDSQVIIKDSQEQRAGSADVFGGYPLGEARVSESPAPRGMSQLSQIPDPTQDAGFVLSPFDPTRRFLGTPPASTIETVLVEQNNSPIAARKLKGLRRGKTMQLSAIVEEEHNDFEIDASAFDVMKKASKKRSEAGAGFDRKTSKAKDIVEEAAEESDDEYAGIGGASDDEASDEENAYDREMINDNSGEKVDAKQLAALNALHQRNADEKEVAKLLKDITTGALRRRRGADDEFDLDDSDDELLARRRQKQREFARMRNALLADGKIGEIAENPKKAAFFRAIEDRDDDTNDVGFDFLDYGSQSQDGPSTQEGDPESRADATQEESNKRKRPLEPAAEDANNRPPPHLRRRPASEMSKRPATLAEIRETVSFLTERPEYDSFHEDASVDEDEGEEADDTNDVDGLLATRQRDESVSRTHPRRTRGPVVDRLALLRQASSNSANSGSANTRFAFHTGVGADGPGSVGFRPPLVRRTTTSSTSSKSSSTSTSDSSRGVTKSGASTSVAKKGAVNYYTAARERERERELRTKHRGRGSNISALVNKHAANRLGALGGTGQWE